MSSGTLLLRADAHETLGTGHVMRCLALAQAWQDAGGEARLAAARLGEDLRRRLAGERVTVIDVDAAPGSPADARATAALAADAPWVAADGYEFGEAFQRAVRQAGPGLLVLDDYGHASRYDADILLNQNLHATPGDYEARAPGARLLLGPRYALLRREFLAHLAGRQRDVPDVAHDILVSFGGSDPHDLAATAIRAIRRIDEPVFRTTVVAGNDSARARLAALAGGGRQEFEVLGHVCRMPELLGRADLAIGAAGGSSWERALARLPSVVVTVADNQVPIARSLQDAGWATNLGPCDRIDDAALAEAVRALALDAALRRRQSDAAGAGVDGRGAARVVEAMGERR